MFREIRQHPVWKGPVCDVSHVQAVFFEFSSAAYIRKTDTASIIAFHDGSYNVPACYIVSLDDHLPEYWVLAAIEYVQGAVCVSAKWAG